jgi:hypothetical protein
MINDPKTKPKDPQAVENQEDEGNNTGGGCGTGCGCG